MIRGIAIFILATVPAYGKTLPACACNPGQVKHGCLCPGPVGPPRLANCTLPAFTPSEAQPFELDACTINDGDDVTELLKDIGNAYGAVYVRAPSRTLSVAAQTTQWTVKNFVFLESPSATNRLTVNHLVPNVLDTYAIAYEGTTYKGATLWTFQDHVYVKIGGPNLTLTLVGTHPGLGTGDYITAPYADPTPKYKENVGFIEARMVDGSSPDLFDVRANIRFTHRYSIYTYNGQVEPSPGSTAYRIKQLNVAGVHYATSGVFFHQGVQKAWADPDRFVVTDPYARGFGYTGVASTTTEGGLTVGCIDQARAQVRLASFSGYYVDEIKGGVTVEYGASNFVQRFSGKVGSEAEPFVIKLKDTGISGPGTPYPAGLRMKLNTEGNFFKGDPHDSYPGVIPARFVRFERLTPTYGDGPGAYATFGCTPDLSAWGGGFGNFARIDSNVPGRSNRGWSFEFSGDWSTNYYRQLDSLFWFGHATETSDPAYDNTLRLASGTTLPDTIVLHDRDTVTGPGTFTNLRVSDLNGVNQGKDSNIIDTNVAGIVTIDPDTENTTIRNVIFTGAARAVITVGANSTVNASALIAPVGSTITGPGSATYNGTPVTLPYLIP